MALTPEEKRALLARLLREKAQKKTRRAPLSFAQERMWFLEQWNPGTAAASMPVAVRLSGTVQLEALRSSLQELVGRHEVLRTTFLHEEGRPLQVIAASVQVPLSVVDLGDVPAGEREEEARRRMLAEARQPFDLSPGPLLRALLLKLDERTHVLFVNMHHIVSDGWSMGVLVRELAALYQAFTEGRPSPLPALPLQYADYADWQRQALQGEAMEAQLHWWRERLDANAVLELPTDRPRPAVLGAKGARRVVELPLELTRALKGLAQREGTTLYCTLLAAFQTLLHRYTGQEDIAVGSPVAGRNRAETEGLIGLFVNTLVMRARLHGNPAFRELLGQVHETALEAFAHQELPFEKLVDALQPKRSTRHAPLFQVMFVLQNAPMPPLRLPGLEMDAQPVDSGTTKFDLTLIAVDLPHGLRFTAEYSTDLFDAETMERLLGHLRVLLEAVVAAPDTPLARLPLLTEPERQQLLREWNDTSAELPRDACIHHVFQEQVRRTPEALAVTWQGSRLTYAELDARANQIAWHLRSLGV
ncbi:MAG TPA: condensation domain-containing protein, partial [Myxococcaceae bacterium]|nr:condensation domain-containing protein [Myxococcaceae bacterium]